MISRRNSKLILLVVFAATLFYPLLFAPFNSLDDRKLITFLINHDSLPLSWHFFPGGIESYYRPIITLSYAFDKAVWGLEESFMHLENILVHLINVLMVYMLGRQLLRSLKLDQKPSARWFPLVAAGLFAVHPLNVEAVAWVTARTDLLAGTFVLGSLFAVLAALETGSFVWGGSAVAILGLGTLCKETALFFIPGVSLLLTGRYGSDVRLSFWKRALVLTIMLVMVGGYFSLRSHAFAHDRGMAITVKTMLTAPVISSDGTAIRTGGHPTPSMIARLGWDIYTAIKATGFYARKVVFPWPLNFAIDRVGAAYFWVGLAVWVGAACLARQRRMQAGLLLTSLGLACSALIVALSPVAWTPIAERYMYVPLGPFLLGVVFWAGPGLLDPKRCKTGIAVLSIIFVSWAATTLWRSYIWQDNLRLYRDTAEKSPDFAPAKNELANALAERGRRREGLELLESLNMPASQSASLGRAAVLAEQGNFEGARQFLEGRLEKTPAHSVEILEALIGVTNRVIQKTGDEQLKKRYYLDILGWLKQLERMTHNPFHWYREGRIYLLLGDRENARRCFAEAARRLPENSIYREPATKLARDLTE